MCCKPVAISVKATLLRFRSMKEMGFRWFGNGADCQNCLRDGLPLEATIESDSYVYLFRNY
jgi:hypothetical protein